MIMNILLSGPSKCQYKTQNYRIIRSIVYTFIKYKTTNYILIMLRS